MEDTHGLILTETEMHDIADAVDKSRELTACKNADAKDESWNKYEHQNPKSTPAGSF